jgi:pimeloyl-ACP methyl ester carboxylesterase
MSETIHGETDRASVSFAGAGGSRIDAWLFRPNTDVATGTTIVMAHGIGGIKSAGLAPFAKRFAAAGHTCVVFDYRHFGASEGSPRELLSIRAERDDYRRALTFARQLPETSRTVVWGCSFAGLHATWHAIDDGQLAAAIAICPLVDGARATLSKPITLSARLMAAGLADALGSALRRPPRYVPISVPEGTFGVLPASDSMRGRTMLAPTDGQDWPNRVMARSLLGTAFCRPSRRLGRAKCPVLLVVPDADTAVPTGAALRAAKFPQVTVVRSRGGHYDVYSGGVDFENVVTAQLDFLAALEPTAGRRRTP